MQPQVPNRYTEIYQPMREKAVALQDQFHDFTGGNFKNPQAQVLHSEIRNLLADIDERRAPSGLDFRIKTIQNHLQQAKNAPDLFMDSKHYDYLHRNYEGMRMGLHKFE